MRRHLNISLILQANKPAADMPELAPFWLCSQSYLSEVYDIFNRSSGRRVGNVHGQTGLENCKKYLIKLFLKQLMKA